MVSTWKHYWITRRWERAFALEAERDDAMIDPILLKAYQASSASLSVELREQRMRFLRHQASWMMLAIVCIIAINAGPAFCRRHRCGQAINNARLEPLRARLRATWNLRRRYV